MNYDQWKTTNPDDENLGVKSQKIRKRIRKIQKSPDADPRLVKASRNFARRMKKEGNETIPDQVPEAPMILPNRAKPNK